MKVKLRRNLGDSDLDQLARFAHADWNVLSVMIPQQVLVNSEGNINALTYYT